MSICLSVRPSGRPSVCLPHRFDKVPVTLSPCRFQGLLQGLFYTGSRGTREDPCCFSRSSVEFQGHMGRKSDDLAKILWNPVFWLVFLRVTTLISCMNGMSSVLCKNRLCTVLAQHSRCVFKLFTKYGSPCMEVPHVGRSYRIVWFALYHYNFHRRSLYSF